MPQAFPGQLGDQDKSLPWGRRGQQVQRAPALLRCCWGLRSGSWALCAGTHITFLDETGGKKRSWATGALGAASKTGKELSSSPNAHSHHYRCAQLCFSFRSKHSFLQLVRKSEKCQPETCHLLFDELSLNPEKKEKKICNDMPGFLVGLPRARV